MTDHPLASDLRTAEIIIAKGMKGLLKIMFDTARDAHCSAVKP